MTSPDSEKNHLKDRNPTIVRALIKFAQLMDLKYNLRVSEAGLLSLADDKQFRRLPNNASLDGKPLYMAFELPPLDIELETKRHGLKKRSVNTIRKYVQTLEKASHAGLKERTASQDHVDVQYKDNKIYIGVKPFMDTPDHSSKHFSFALEILSRRGFFATAGGMVAAGLLTDGFRRARTPENSDAHKVGGVVEGAFGGAIGAKSAKIGIKILSRTVQEAVPYLDPRPSKNQWENFMIALRMQLGVQKEDPQRSR